jgi:hypothetical protein
LSAIPGGTGRVTATVVVAVTLVAAGLAPAGAGASRQPTFSEREALTAALPSFVQAEPAGCVWLDITVSGNGGYAKVAPGFLNALHAPCAKYASNGWWILKKTGPRWKIVFNGSESPPCALRIPKDLANACRP